MKQPGSVHTPRWRFRMAAAALLVVTLITGGCGEKPQTGRVPRRTVAISDLPENVIGAAKRELPDVEFNDAWKNVDKDGNVQSYEVRGRNPNGKIREVRVSTTGEILEKE